jgi:peptidoglycan/xylan/chitin deacetylase (PgdA/CDA1 family)
VLQHDGGGPRSETLAALPREIDTLRGEGYTFVTVTQLLGQKLIYK